MKYIITILLVALSFNLFAQKKEVLIVGTMHTVPNLIKNSYQPLLKFSKTYNPEAIYVEYVRPNDTISLVYDTPRFVEKSDSLKKVFTTNPKRFNTLMKTDLNKFSQDDFAFVANSYLVKRDNANYSYFNYLEKYGINGSDEPLRHENDDLTAQLAISLNLKYLYSMDDQQSNEAYHIAWEKCNEHGAENGDNEINRKLGRKQYLGALVPALLGRFGHRTNRFESLNRLDLLSSFGYVQYSSIDCENATKYWDERNYRMAKNIAEQIQQEPNIKNIVFVGAAHVVGIAEVLKERYPELNVKLMHDE